MEREACKIWWQYFKMFAAWPTVTSSEFWDKPFEFLFSFFMAIVSSNQVNDVLVLLYFHRKNCMNLAKFALIFIITTLFNALFLKPLFHQPRPDLGWIHSNGMPSGHSAASGINFWVAILLYRKGWILSKRICVIFWFLMMCVGYSRIYLYYHTTAQVIFGFTYGVIFTYLIHYFIPFESTKAKQTIRVELKKYYQKPEYNDEDEEANMRKKTI